LPTVPYCENAQVARKTAAPANAALRDSARSSRANRSPLIPASTARLAITSVRNETPNRSNSSAFQYGESGPLRYAMSR
jgi:hypothetical protein